MLEYEKKILLTKDEYLLLVALAGKRPTKLIQKNYYFDTDDFAMNRKGVTCRIREKDGKFKATIKSHCVEKKDCSFEYDLHEKDSFNPNAFQTIGLSLQGELVTERIILHKDSACEVVVDKNTYLGKTDYELEIEYAEGQEGQAEIWLAKLAAKLSREYLNITVEQLVSRANVAKSKSERFFQIRKQP